MSTPYHTFERWRSDYREYVRLNEYGDHVIDDEGVRKIEAELAERQANHEHDERLCISRAKRIKELEAKLAGADDVAKLREALVEIMKRSGRIVAEIAAKALKETEASR